MEMESEKNYENEARDREITHTEIEEKVEEAQRTGEVNMKQNIEKQPETGSHNYTHKFSKTVEIMGQKYKEMTFYFDELTGEDIEAVEEELQDQQRYVLSPEISSVFQAMLAARAAKIGSDEIRKLPIGDYMKIKNKARDFLVAAGY